MTVLRHVPQPIEQLLGLLQEVAELVHDLPLVLLHVLVHLPHTDTGVSKNDASIKLHSDLKIHLLSQRIRYRYLLPFAVDIEFEYFGYQGSWVALLRVIWLFL